MIKESDLVQWADSHDCRTKLPILIRRLIYETTPALSVFRFLGNDAVDLSGLDGIVETTTQTYMVPYGYSIWEIGCNKKIRDKADSDYAKRTETIDYEKRRKSSFIFITPRRWTKKSEWVEGKKKNKDWLEVRAYDSVDIETWLERAPITSYWFAEVLGKGIAGVLSPQEWWQKWSSATNPPLPTQIVTRRRLDQQSILLDKLRNKVPVITIIADDRQEAIAYVIASLIENKAEDILNRMLVLKESLINFVPADYSFLIPDSAENSIVEYSNQKNITIIRTYSRNYPVVQDTITLSHVASGAFYQEFQNMGYTNDEAINLARKTGHSVPILRRYLAIDPEIKTPSWARDREIATRLVPFVLVGEYLEKGTYDDTIVIEMIAEIKEYEIKKFQNILLNLNDAPLVKYGEVIKVVSQLDALMALGKFIEAEELDRFFQVAAYLLSERDPVIDLPLDKWWLANLYKKVRCCSPQLLVGICNTLCILSIYGDQICGKRLDIDCEYRVSEIVNLLLFDATQERWLSIRNYLSLLAEASPSTFLDCLENDLGKAIPGLKVLFSSYETGVSGTYLWVDLLWALEILAWNKGFFKRVVQIVFQLCQFEIAGNLSNRPENTAKSLFCIWLPGTTLSVNEKIEILRDLSSSNRQQVLEVCISLLPSMQPSIATPNVQPKWRPIEMNPDEPTDREIYNGGLEASHLILDMAPYQLNELKEILHNVTLFPLDDLQRLNAEIQRYAEISSDEEKVTLLSIIRGNAVYLNSINIDISEQRKIIKEMIDTLQPKSLLLRYSWLFEPGVEWKMFDSNCVAQITQQREYAIIEIEKNYSKQELLNFLVQLNVPIITIPLILKDKTIIQERGKLIQEILLLKSNKVVDNFLQCLLDTTDDRYFPVLIEWIIKNNILSYKENFSRFIRALPGRNVGWTAAELLGGDKEYWENVSINCFCITPSDATYAVSKLFEVDRPLAAFSSFYLKPKLLHPEIWCSILVAIGSIDFYNNSYVTGYNINNILQYIESNSDLSLEQLQQIEFPFLLCLCHSSVQNNKRILAIHRLISKNPNVFIELLNLRYGLPDSEDLSAREEVDENKLDYFSKIAFRVLNSWTLLPGAEINGEFDCDTFFAWFSEMKKSAASAQYTKVALCYVGQLLGHYVRDRQITDWLPGCLLDELEKIDNNILREEFMYGILNSRGVTCRDPYDGGKLERIEADKYCLLSKSYEVSHPRVATMLIKLAKIYINYGKKEDENAAINERW